MTREINLNPNMEEKFPFPDVGNTVVKELIKTIGTEFSLSEFDDFEAYLANLRTGNSPDKVMRENIQNLSPAQKEEVLKLLQKLGLQSNIPININNIDNIKMFLRSAEISGDKEELKINFDNFEKKDIDFLISCFENKTITFNPQNLQTNFAIQSPDGQVSYKSTGVSKSLFSLIEYSFKAQKPVRIDFNGNSSVILKMHNNGKLVAHFISNDQAAEYMLKSSIPGLKEKLDAEGIPYEEISYKDKSDKNKKHKQQNKGDNQ